MKTSADGVFLTAPSSSIMGDTHMCLLDFGLLLIHPGTRHLEIHLTQRFVVVAEISMDFRRNYDPMVPQWTREVRSEIVGA